MTTLRIASVVLIGAGCCAVSPRLSAQCVSQETIGREVRIAAPSSGIRSHRGVLVRADCAAVEVTDDDASILVATGDITGMAVKVKRRSKAALGAAIGLVVGAAPPLIHWAGCPADASNSGAVSCEGAAVFMAMVTVPLGVLLGVAVGAGMGVDSWQPVPIDMQPVAVVATEGGVGLRLGFRF